ncbi:MAG: GPW/gp25 family protein [Muribaculum sp.]|nr:GPW/gp25 family protein [Muribaculum sp.]
MSTESRGCKFPFTVSGEHGRVEVSELRDNIRESVKIILLTEPGERILHPDFGTKLHQFLFENIDDRTQEMIRREIRHSLGMWEKRIANVMVDADARREGALHVTVSYEIVGRRESDRAEVWLGGRTEP